MTAARRPGAELPTATRRRALPPALSAQPVGLRPPGDARAFLTRRGRACRGARRLRRADEGRPDEDLLRDRRDGRRRPHRQPRRSAEPGGGAGRPVRRSQLESLRLLADLGHRLPLLGFCAAQRCRWHQRFGDRRLRLQGQRPAVVAGVPPTIQL